MPLNIKKRTDIVSSLSSYVRAYIPDLDPTVTRRRGWIGGMVRSLGSSVHDWHVKLKRYADYEPHPQTATENFFTTGWWIDVTKLSRNPEASATGKVVVTGANGTVLSSGSVLTGSNQSYTTDNSITVVAQSISATSLTRDGSTAIFETSGAHYLATGQSVTISGANETDYNGSFEITVTAANEFTYDLGAATPTTPATGTIQLAATWGIADITAENKGQDTNIGAGASLAISSPPAGIDSTATVTFGEIAGGSDLEDLDDWRARVLEKLGTDFGMFSADEIEIVAKQVPGVTRVFVRKATLGGTNGVFEGQVKVAFMRDDDANPFPSGQEVTTVKDHLIAEILPAHVAEDDLIVVSPTRNDVDFTFSAISPDTGSMRLAITANLQQLFNEVVTYGTDITEDQYRCAINDTFDSERGEALQSFTLSTPSGTISIGDDEMPYLGTVTFT
jgi:uncharacterized phage protein gp47/JayE